MVSGPTSLSLTLLPTQYRSGFLEAKGNGGAACGTRTDPVRANSPIQRSRYVGRPVEDVECNGPVTKTPPYVPVPNRECLTPSLLTLVTVTAPRSPQQQSFDNRDNRTPGLCQQSYCGTCMLGTDWLRLDRFCWDRVRWRR